MTTNNIIFTKFLYNFFIILSLNIFFFSTVKAHGKAFNIDNIEISRPFEINFNKDIVIDEGFKKSFNQLISTIVNSSEQTKINKAKLNEIKGMIDSFSIKEEKFIDDIYHVNLGVSFNKKKVFNYLEKKNIFPSIPIREKFLFIPIIIDTNERDLLVFDKNKIFNEWNKYSEKFELIDYILPTEDLEDLNLIKSKFENIEQYNFKDITKKYDLNNSIITLVFKNQNMIRILSRININNNLILKNQTYFDIDIENDDHIKNMVKDLKIIYEDYWKSLNQINTSLKLPLNIKIINSDNQKIKNFEETLSSKDLIYDFYISKFDNEFIYYQIIFNGTSNIFLKTMEAENYNFDTQNKMWKLK